MKIEGGKKKRKGNHNRGFQQYLYHIIHTSYVWFETLESRINQSNETQFSRDWGGVHGHSTKGVPKVAG